MSKPLNTICAHRLRLALGKAAVLAFSFLCCLSAAAQNVGALRVTVFDQDWDVPVNEAQVSLLEKNQRKATHADGQILFENLESGVYTLSVGASGFQRKVLPSVTVVAGQVQTVECKIQADYTDMDEFVVKDFDITLGASELTQLQMRSQSSALMDNIGADMMSKAGASTAAAALKMVTGATIQDGKYAVIRGLSDRYTSTTVNGIRMPNADRDRRAVSMDQFPSSMIESVQVSKTFMPDQQGDSTGGINIKTKGVPDHAVLAASFSTEYDSNATGNGDFKSYKDGGNDFMGMRGLTSPLFWNDDINKYPRGSEINKTGTAADKQYSTEITNHKPPANSGFKFAVGDYTTVGDWQVGGMLLGSYSQKYKYRSGTQSSLYKVEDVKAYRDDPTQTQSVETSTDEQLWSTGFMLGAKNDYNSIQFMTLYTHQSKDMVELRYKPSNTTTNVVGVDNTVVGTSGRPPRPILYPTAQHLEKVYTRDYEATLDYTENANGIVQLSGDHTFSALNDSVLDWSGSYNMAESIEPDRRKISGSYVEKENLTQNNTATYPNDPVWNTPTVTGSTNYMTSSIERRWQDTREDDVQGQLNYKQPYEVAEGWAGWFKTGVFKDHVERTYRNRIYVIDGGTVPSSCETDFSGYSGAVDDIPLGGIYSESMEYNGEQDIDAWYLMGRIPFPEWLDLVGGARVENTSLKTKVFPSAGNNSFYLYEKVTEDLIKEHPDAYNENQLGLIARNSAERGDGDASIEQTDVLPAVSANLKPIDEISLRLSYSETIARPMFKEITPVKYMDYDSSRVFLGNPDLTMSALKNYDARLEWRPDKKKADMVAVGVYYKTITDPIQYSVRSTISPDVDYIYPENYGDAEIKGAEFEARKGLGFLSRYLEEVSLGGNLTLQESEVQYRDDIRTQLLALGIKNKTRPMDGQSDILANVNAVFENAATGLSFGLFYNWRGETYAAGDTASPEDYFPAIVEKPIGTLDFVIGYKFRLRDSRYLPEWKLGLEFKNLLDPDIETVYRTPYKDIPRTTYTQGRIYGLSLGCEW
jgi:outer membrane receptor protein involved in Fe transport